MEPIMILFSGGEKSGISDIAGYLRLSLKECGFRTTQLKKLAGSFVKLEMDPAIQTADAFFISSKITDMLKGTVTVTLRSNTIPGLYAAVGTWTRGEAKIMNYSSRPTIQSRSIYFATHFNVVYVAQSLKEWKKYLQNLMAWGMNTIWMCFDFREYHHPWSPEAEDFPRERRQWIRLCKTLQLARKMGLHIGIGQPANVGFRGQVGRVCRAKPMPRFTGDLANTEICPSTKKGRQLILSNSKRFFKEFSFIDYLGFGSLDPGGCGCKNCMPWVGQGYLSLSIEMAQAAKEIIPEVKVLLMDTYAEKEDKDRMLKALRERRANCIDGLMTFWDHLTNPFPVYNKNTAKKHLSEISSLLHRKKELWIFPDLSMTFSQRKNGKKIFDWGQTGANPLPSQFCDIMKFSDRIKGVMPYSEGIFDDFNKIAILMSSWKPGVSKYEVIEAYRCVYFPLLNTDSFKDIILGLEKNKAHLPENEFALETYKLLKKAEKKLTDKERQSWRWKVLRERVFIDAQIVYASRGERHLKKARQEIVESAERLRFIYKEPKKRFPLMDGQSTANRLLDLGASNGKYGEGVI